MVNAAYAATFAVPIVLSGCAPHQTAPQTALPEAFGVTMVEETTCIGQGGAIEAGADGAFGCVGAQEQESGQE